MGYYYLSSELGVLVPILVLVLVGQAATPMPLPQLIDLLGFAGAGVVFGAAFAFPVGAVTGLMLGLIEWPIIAIEWQLSGYGNSLRTSTPPAPSAT